VSGVAVRSLSIRLDGVTVVDGVSLDVSAGEWLGLIGPNGAGKTTLLRAVAGLVDATGDIAVADSAVRGTDRRALARLIAYVPQRPLLPEGMPVLDYVLIGRAPYISYLGVEGPGDVAVAAEVLERLGLEPLVHRRLGTLSGGEVQRVVLARALAQRAPVLLLDEPTAALDLGHQQQALELIDALRKERELTVIAAMHDLTHAAQFADRLAMLANGRLVAEGRPEEVLDETSIRRHYGATVRVTRGPGGELLVIPVRTAVAATEAAR
jgi:iron complex transport system ATP-binding protein